ncbi:MAG: ammonia monooxygenase, partial [Candidatus Thioglobus sp.]
MVNKKTTTLVFALGAVMVLGTLAPQLLVMVQTAKAHGVQAQLQSRFIKIEDETFNRQSLATGETLTMSGKLVSLV